MKKIVINGGRPLKGEVTISGAKNSVVALIPATILADDIVTLDGGTGYLRRGEPD